MQASGSSSSPRRRRVLLFLLPGILIAGGLWFRFNGQTAIPKGGPPAQPVRVATAQLRDVPEFLNGLGTVTPSASVVVRSRVDGQLVRLHFEDGQTVKEGELLAEIDPRPFEASLAEAKGQLAKDQAILENARRDLARYNRLSKGDFIAAQEVDTQRATVRQYEGIVKTDQAQVEAAALQLAYSRITAPISGRLGLRSVDAGNMIHASDSNGLVTITRTEPSDVIFTLPESRVPLVMAALRRGDPLPVQAWDREQKALLATGTLLTVDNRIDTATGTVKLKARFPNTDGMLFPNQFVNARLLVRTLKDAVTIPASAVQLGAKGSFVYVVDGNGTAHTRPVELGWNTSTLAVADKGVAPGEVVVIDGLDRLRDGIKVLTVNAEEAPDGTTQPTPARAASPDAAATRPARGDR